LTGTNQCFDEHLVPFPKKLNPKGIIMHFLHIVHEMNTYRAAHVCLSLCMIQLEKHWMDLVEIWYGGYAIGDYPKNHTLQFPAVNNITMADNKLVRCYLHQHHLQWDHTVMYGYRFLENTKFWNSNSVYGVK
jgi:hypothetical protein